MIRTALGVVAGFLGWIFAWFGAEKALSALLPEMIGVHQQAFQNALVTGGKFTANSTLLMFHIGLGILVSLFAGYFSALISGESKRAPLILGILVAAIGVLKAVMSWPYVPIWYHVIFTGLLLPMIVVGGKLKKTT